ncbi:STAS/SEC14 domain-containing protein [Thalassotalea sp. LPB0316]|uniref:STAS/SEC14 domain-containing protein n=1 Tax=Thalassotalea sp. LPB0316 TaxID=2769490 RepID=UPI001868463A|nr:STAS/SEC14 domain-containing protein [Thalassotalea sp. LPB0316]QOL25983.1 STAS/SEC14 domain-containing protein [Thalassotalea sp. LPB0316]
MIKKLAQSSGPYLGFVVSGKAGLAEEQAWNEEIEQAISTHNKVSLLIVLSEGVHWGVDNAWQDIKWLFAHMRHFDKVAIVSSSAAWHWLITIDSFFAALMNIDEKHFSPNELDNAWQWLKANQ